MVLLELLALVAGLGGLYGTASLLMSRYDRHQENRKAMRRCLAEALAVGTSEALDAWLVLFADVAPKKMKTEVERRRDSLYIEKNS